MSSHKTFVLPSLWFGPAYVWFMLFRAHSRPSSERACLGLPWKIYVRKFHADGIRWFNTLDNLKQFIVEPRRPLRLASTTRPKTNKHGKFYGSGSAVMGWDGGEGRGRTKVVFLLFYFIALTSLNMFACLVRTTCFFSLISFATSSRRRAGRRARVACAWCGMVGYPSELMCLLGS